MSRIAWAKLMRAGVVEMGLSPEAFWALTPAELMLMAGQETGRTMTRAGLDALIARFPDRMEGGSDGGSGE